MRRVDDGSMMKVNLTTEQKMTQERGFQRVDKPDFIGNIIRGICFLIARDNRGDFLPIKFDTVICFLFSFISSFIFSLIFKGVVFILRSFFY